MATKLPTQVMIHGRQRHVIESKPNYWVEREESGRLIIHAGKLLLDGHGLGAKLIDTPRKCGVCKGPTYTTTDKGRPIHDTCEGQLDVMPDQLYGRVVFGVAADLGATILGSA